MIRPSDKEFFRRSVELSARRPVPRAISTTIAMTMPVTVPWPNCLAATARRTSITAAAVCVGPPLTVKSLPVSDAISYTAKSTTPKADWPAATPSTSSAV